MAVLTIIVVQLSAFGERDHMGKVKRWFEQTLVSIRFLALLAVIASLIGCLGMFYISTVDLWKLFVQMAGYIDAISIEGQHRGARATTISYVIELVDGYLLALMMLIFAIGIYQLFCRIDRTQIVDESGAVWVVNSLRRPQSQTGQGSHHHPHRRVLRTDYGHGYRYTARCVVHGWSDSPDRLALYLSHAR